MEPIEVKIEDRGNIPSEASKFPGRNHHLTAGLPTFSIVPTSKCSQIPNRNPFLPVSVSLGKLFDWYGLL